MKFLEIFLLLALSVLQTSLSAPSAAQQKDARLETCR